MPSADWTTLAPPEPSRAPSCSVAVPTRRASAASAAAATKNVDDVAGAGEMAAAAASDDRDGRDAISMRSRLVTAAEPTRPGHSA